jgi:hypothetical protein
MHGQTAYADPTAQMVVARIAATGLPAYQVMVDRSVIEERRKD